MNKLYVHETRPQPKPEILTLAVWGTGVRRHNERSIQSPLKPLNTIVLQCTQGFMVALNSASMMPRDASL